MRAAALLILVLAVGCGPTDHLVLESIEGGATLELRCREGAPAVVVQVSVGENGHVPDNDWLFMTVAGSGQEVPLIVDRTEWPKIVEVVEQAGRLLVPVLAQGGTIEVRFEDDQSWRFEAPSRRQLARLRCVEIPASVS